MMPSSRRPTKNLHCNGEAPQTWQGSPVPSGSMWARRDPPAAAQLLNLGLMRLVCPAGSANAANKVLLKNLTPTAQH